VDESRPLITHRSSVFGNGMEISFGTSFGFQISFGTSFGFQNLPTKIPTFQVFDGS
jgi:hypothetical protein